MASTSLQVHCPFCSASPGEPCRNRDGQTLAGTTHFQRVRRSRSAIHAALDFYAQLGLRRSEPSLKVQ